MQSRNQNVGSFRNLGAQGGQQQSFQQRGFGAQQPSAPQGGYYNDQHQQDDNQAVAWMNLYLTTETGEKKKLGKGIPLRENSPLERAILDLFYDENGEETGFTAEDLISAMTLDIRPAGSPDQEVRIAIGGFKKPEAEAPAPKLQRATRQEPSVDDQDAIEQLEPEAKATRPTRQRIKKQA